MDEATATVEDVAPETTVETAEEFTHTPLADLFSNDTPQDAKSASPEGVVDNEKVADDQKAPELEVKDEEIKTPSPETIKAEADARIKETRVAYDRLAQEKAELQRQYQEQAAYLQMINKKLDGNWTDEDERLLQGQLQPKQTSPEEAAQQGHTEGKIAASREAAYEIFGKEMVEKTLFAEDAPFRSIMDDPIVSQKVLSSNAPVIEAMKIVQVKKFYDKWGYEPATIEKNMRESMEKELTDKITQKVIKQMQGKSVTTGIRDVRSIDVKGDTVYSAPTTKELFG